MGKFLVRRAAQAILVLLVTTFGSLVAVTEWGDPFRMIGPRVQTPEARAMLNETFGLDKPLFVRYLVYIGNLFTGDLGVDYERRRPVVDLLAEAAPNSFRLALTALAIQVVLGVVLGIVAARMRRTFVDTVITFTSITVTVIPLFVIGVWVRNAFSGKSIFGWDAFPLIPRSIGVETTWLQELILPAFTLGVGALAFTVVLARGAMIEVLDADYIRTARAKGLSERKVVFKHAARNALIPVAELSAVQLGALMGGTVLVEAVFQYNGLGYLFVRSMTENNHPVMLAVAVYSVALFVIVLMLADILTAWLDPRIRIFD
ncbi:ABC transporter permease [Actinophytocola algeriensis]|uniref:Oligopeptide transport system permease protein n=1 Tax=Actinophytocola algeriensis TaxID=1768010 RepID=A0A7W7QEE8_9PSEU|nr:ABC transporter permease [Actinophytocola algeriensis]MBB4911933.1 oligopeptide transport system permease protein [Actinophytocola algeriensis]MBE1477575.1 oligopeptide transport system permease protein [Actinophytocola algeriensis]